MLLRLQTRQLGEMGPSSSASTKSAAPKLICSALPLNLCISCHLLAFRSWSSVPPLPLCQYPPSLPRQRQHGSAFCARPVGNISSRQSRIDARVRPLIQRARSSCAGVTPAPATPGRAAATCAPLRAQRPPEPAPPHAAPRGQRAPRPGGRAAAFRPGAPARCSGKSRPGTRRQSRFRPPAGMRRAMGVWTAISANMSSRPSAASPPAPTRPGSR